MKCTICGFDNTDKSKFCKKCGTKFEKLSNVIFCRFCGKKAVLGTLYCTDCGKPLQYPKKVEPKEDVREQEINHLLVEKATVENDSMEIVEEKRKNSKKVIKWIVIGFILIAIIVSIIGICVKSYLDDKKGNNDLNIDTEQESESIFEGTEFISDEYETEFIESEGEIQIEKELTVEEYQDICSSLLKLNSAYGSSNEQMAVKMAQSIVEAKILNKNTNYRFQDISEDDRNALIYKLGESDEYGLQTYDGRYIEDGPGNYFGGIIYKVEEFKELVEAFCEYKIVYEEADFGNYIGFPYTDGDPWEYFDVYDIKESEDYVFIHASCYEGDNSGTENVYQYTLKVLFKKTKENMLGLQVVYVEGYDNNINAHISSIEATSYLPNYKDKTYRPENLIDENYATPWVENADGIGIGESIQIKLDQKIWVQELVFLNGYQSSESTFLNNGYVRKLAVDFGNGITTSDDCYAFYAGPVKDGNAFNKISLDRPVYTDTIIITILDAVAGKKYSDICISEIELH